LSENKKNKTLVLHPVWVVEGLQGHVLLAELVYNRSATALKKRD
jgi:hypothetical protein